LLFSEYKKHHSINFKRFLIRRGLKIYPAFYVFLGFTFAYELVFHRLSSLGQYLSELFYVQNYGTAIWGHTWSLAVEEHFYILLPLFFLFLVRYSSNRADPFRVMPWAFLVVAATCLALRVASVMRVPEANFQEWALHASAYGTTHKRLDSLFFGVLLGYLHHFRPQFFETLFRPAWSRMALALSACALLSTGLFFPLETRYMLTIGFAVLYLGFGIILMLSLYVHGVLPSFLAKPAEQIGKAFAYAGMYSYSIYLWHYGVRTVGVFSVYHFLHIRMSPLASTIFYLTVSIPLGILMSRLVEYPVLRFRDRIFPSLTATAAQPSDGTVAKDAATVTAYVIPENQ
jgi:peptidoglycan/LPS O-acetylase OafA/YrhL